MLIMSVGGSSKDHTPEQDFSSHQIFRIYQLYMSQSTWKDGGGAGALLGPSTRSADQKKPEKPWSLIVVGLVTMTGLNILITLLFIMTVLPCPVCLLIVTVMFVVVFRRLLSIPLILLRGLLLGYSYYSPCSYYSLVCCHCSVYYCLLLLVICPSYSSSCYSHLL